jgi:hypothetical protein
MAACHRQPRSRCRRAALVDRRESFDDTKRYMELRSDPKQSTPVSDSSAGWNLVTEKPSLRPTMPDL